MPDVQLSREEFDRRFRAQFFDPAFAAVRAELDAVAEIAWQAYSEYRKSPRTQPAGDGFAEPGFELPIEWLEARRRIQAAEARRGDPAAPDRFLVVNGSSRSDRSCPGEMSKTFRLARIAQQAIEQQGGEVDLLDLSRLISEYGRTIHPCKACVSTSMPLCHWPCSCYPNHAIGQAQDWMNDIYPRWAAAHGVLLVSPVHWYQAPSVLKLMIDRLVCADGGNPDPTSTRGKDPARAKALELAGWDYPKHLAGRAFAIVVHGDTDGVESLARDLGDWLTDLGLIEAGPLASVARYVGYYRPYATSHDDLDSDEALQQETRNAAASLVAAARDLRRGVRLQPDVAVRPPRQK
jgi:multimeric flavodoxin WrbA